MSSRVRSDGFDCWACYNGYCAKHPEWAFYNPPTMYLCSECGDERCVKAADHHNRCDHGHASYAMLEAHYRKEEHHGQQ